VAETTFSVLVNLAKLFLVRSPVWMVPSLICAEVMWPAATEAPVPASAAIAPTATTWPTLPRAVLVTQLLSFMVHSGSRFRGAPDAHRVVLSLH